MSRIQALLIALFSVAALYVGFSEITDPQSQQAVVISAFVAAAGITGLLALVVLHGSEAEQAKFDCHFIGVAGMILETSPNYGVWQDAIDRLNVIAARTIWTPLQKKNAAEARVLLNEAGEGDDSLSALLRGSAA